MNLIIKQNPPKTTFKFIYMPYSNLLLSKTWLQPELILANMPVDHFGIAFACKTLKLGFSIAPDFSGRRVSRKHWVVHIPLVYTVYVMTSPLLSVIYSIKTHALLRRAESSGLLACWEVWYIMCCPLSCLPVSHHVNLFICFALLLCNQNCVSRDW